MPTATYREWTWPGHDAVRCLWSAPAAAAPRPVLPDGCLDIIWRNGALFVAGPDTRAVMSSPGGPTAGVRFRPGRAGPALGASPRELLDDRVPLTDLWGTDADRLHEQLATTTDPAEAAQLIARALAARTPAAPAPDPLAEEAVRRIEAAAGRIRMSALATHLQTGERQLRERVTTQVGYGPKMFARVIRLHVALHAVRHTGDELAEIAVGTGFADQAHLTRELRALTGSTPAEHRAGFFKTALLAS